MWELRCYVTVGAALSTDCLADILDVMRDSLVFMRRSDGGLMMKKDDNMYHVYQSSLYLFTSGEIQQFPIDLGPHKLPPDGEPKCQDD